MTKKWQLKEKARELRRQGLSYKEIMQKVPVAKGTISIWCRNIPLTKAQIARLGALYDTQLRGAKANQLKRQREIKKIRLRAKRGLRSLNKYEFKIAGTMLYWAEGDKTLAVGITNSDPELIRFMMKWFRKVCHVPEEKFRAHIHIHTGQNENRMKKYWSNVTDIPLRQFGKSYLKKEGTGHRKNILYNGTIKVKICSEDLRHRILSWIEEFYIKK